MGADACPACGFVWADVADDELVGRLVAATDELGRTLVGAGDAAHVRPAPEVWSALEYGAHVRDVVLVLRDRVVLALVQDDPSFTMLHPDQRVGLGLYAADGPEQVAADLAAAVDLYRRFVAPLTPTQLDRPCRYSWPGPAPRSIRWMAQQAVHEAEHHLDDARRSLTGT